MPDRNLLALECAVARAHRAVWSAQGYAEALGAVGLEEDLRALCAELARVGEDLVGRRSPTTVQLRLTGAHRAA